MLINRDGTDNIIHSRVGVTQGEPLTVVDYGIGVLPLMKLLNSAYPGITQPWCADKAGALGFDNLERYLNSLNLNSLD